MGLYIERLDRLHYQGGCLMAISKKTGREYQSRRDRGIKPSNRRYEKQTFPPGFDQWGQPNTCGVIDKATGKECPEPNAEAYSRCEFHQEEAERAQGVQKRPLNPSPRDPNGETGTSK